jgi:hypothetical protein
VLHFQKFRGTPKAWPRLALPSEPLSDEFLKRSAQCERIEASRDGETWRWSYKDTNGRLHGLAAAAGSADFWKAIDKADEVAKRLAAGDRKTFAALIGEIKESPAFKVRDPGVKKRKGNGIAQATKDQYEPHLDAIEAAWGDDPVANLTPVDVQKAIDSYADKPSAGRVFRSVLSRVVS